jgi:ferredoxin
VKDVPACFIVDVSDIGVSFRCSATQTLLEGMETSGSEAIPVGCRGGGCGVCKVRIESGIVHRLKMSRARISIDEERAGLVLACRAYPRSALRVQSLAARSPRDVLGRKGSFLERSLQSIKA